MFYLPCTPLIYIHPYFMFEMSKGSQFYDLTITFITDNFYFPFTRIVRRCLLSSRFHHLSFIIPLIPFSYYFCDLDKKNKKKTPFPILMFVSIY